MMLTFLGTNSGAEPLPGLFHASFVVEHAGGVYWFDAGETCSYNAHLRGIDLLAIRAIFISHTHMDHVGGLANLLWNMRKLNGLCSDPSRRLTGKTVRLYIPNLETWNGIHQLLKNTEGDFAKDFFIDVQQIVDGTLYTDEHGFELMAIHNRHMGIPLTGDPWRSFSFRANIAGISLVYSGDVRHVSELEPVLEGADWLLMETGHHVVDEVCAYLKTCGKTFKNLVFTHHGRKTLSNRDDALHAAREILGERVWLAREGETVDLSACERRAP